MQGQVTVFFYVVPLNILNVFLGIMRNLVRELDFWQQNHSSKRNSAWARERILTATQCLKDRQSEKHIWGARRVCAKREWTGREWNLASIIVQNVTSNCFCFYFKWNSIIYVTVWHKNADTICKVQKKKKKFNRVASVNEAHKFSCSTRQNANETTSIIHECTHPIGV